MFERFANDARLALSIAQDEARQLRQNYVGTEHILIALTEVSKGIAARALTEHGLTTEFVRRHVQRLSRKGTVRPSGQIPLTPKARSLLEQAVREASHLGDNHVGSEHLLLGFLMVTSPPSGGIGGQVVSMTGVKVDRLRQTVYRLSGKDSGSAGVDA